MDARLLSVIGRSLRVYVKPPLQRISIGLGILAARNAGGSTIYAADPIKSIVEHVADALGLDVEVERCREDADKNAVFLWCSPADSPLFVAGPEIRQLARYGLERMIVKTIGVGVYLLEVPRRGMREYVRLSGYIPVPTEPPCREDVMEILGEAIEGGVAPLRDVVDILSSVLGVRRVEARRLVLELAEKGCVELVDGGKAVRLGV
ncbi:hypothetical protein [Pyrodictium delaneyi]|nr:hypothetical protein [Pyrodictium delaneyi]